MNIGQFVAAEIIILLVISSVEKLILGLESFYDILTSLEKIGQVVDKELEGQTGEEPVFNENFKIELENVTYNVPQRDKNILENITMQVHANTSTLIRGESGAGKSSLLRLFAGLIKPTKGTVFLDNFSLNNIHLNKYRGQIGMSLSDETPFEATLRENITFGDASLTDEDVFWAIEKVGLKTFVKEQPKGLHTIINPEGKQIAYTDAKKIILARAIVRKPRLLILEDPLDQFEFTEWEKVMNFLLDKSNNWAVIVVSGNKRWKEKCQNTITLHKGKMI
jgi:ABC-type bacteriocin/lantibiotic exporter with double-glycine peptidase domain